MSHAHAVLIYVWYMILLNMFWAIVNYCSVIVILIFAFVCIFICQVWILFNACLCKI